MDLASRWKATWNDLGRAPDPLLFARILNAYGEPHRHYHTLRHLEECLAQLDLLKAEAERSAEAALALWFHDAVYDPRRGDNEARSAQWAFEALEAVSPAAAARVQQLVMATSHEAVPQGADAHVVVDVDLSILGAPQARFDEYETDVRKEYAWVPEPLYRRARRTILESFLARPAIYRTAHFAGRYEARARKNLERSLSRL